MVRIINNDKKEEAPLDETSKALLGLLASLVAENPERIKELLENYNLNIRQQLDEKELTEQLITAIGYCDKEFNHELAELILENTTEDNYEGVEGGGGGGFLSSVVNTIGSLGSTIGSGKRAREEATSKTLQSIYDYKKQAAAKQQSQSKNKMVLLIGFFVLLGITLASITFYNRKQLIPITS